jgi:hypothetical protein
LVRGRRSTGPTDGEGEVNENRESRTENGKLRTEETESQKKRPRQHEASAAMTNIG